MATYFKEYILMFWLIIIPNSIYMMSPPADRVLPDSCTLVSSSTCRLNSTECSFTATFNLLRPLSRSREYDVTWWLNNNLIYGNTDDFSASEMTMDCTKCSARLFIKGTFKQHHFGDYTFKIRRIKSGEIINCTLRLCEDCQQSNTKEEGASKPDLPYIYIVAGVAGFFIVTPLLLTVKILFKRNKGERPSSHPHPGGAISVDDDSAAVSNHTYASVQLNDDTDYQRLVRNLSRHPYDRPTTGTNVVATSSTSPGTSGAQVKPEVVYAEVSKPTRNDPNPQQLPDVVVHDYKNVRHIRRLS